MVGPIGVIAVLVVLTVLKMTVHVLKEYERAVVFFLGRCSGGVLSGVRGPGLIFIIPFVQQLVRIDQRTETLDIPPQDIITKDNISIHVNAVLYFRVMDPRKAVIEVQNFHYATNQLAQTTLRSVCGEVSLDELLAKREEINLRIQEIIDTNTDPWGIKVSLVEIKHIDLPQEMQRAMAKQAEAERDRRAKIIQAEGEFQAATKLTEAAAIMSKEPISIQLRYLDSLRSIATEHNSTIVFPLPMDLLEVFMGKKRSES